VVSSYSEHITHKGRASVPLSGQQNSPEHSGKNLTAIFQLMNSMLIQGIKMLYINRAKNMQLLIRQFICKMSVNQLTTPQSLYFLLV